MDESVWLRTRRSGVRISQGVQKKAHRAGGLFVYIQLNQIVNMVRQACLRAVAVRRFRRTVQVGEAEKNQLVIVFFQPDIKAIGAECDSFDGVAL